MDYDIYKNVRNASWRCLLDCKIDSLPTELGKICKANGIQVKKNSALNKSALLPNERGRTNYINGKCFIVVKDAEIKQAQRYTIAHELGHILLGHATTESEAERFAIGVLAPACVLWALGANTPVAIANLCDISLTAAANRAKRMKILNQRNMFLTHPLEQQLYEQFKPFIQKKLNGN